MYNLCMYMSRRETNRHRMTCCHQDPCRSLRMFSVEMQIIMIAEIRYER